jgi:hypothetical protein
MVPPIWQRWPPLFRSVALVSVIWGLVLWLLRMRGKRLGNTPSPRALLGHRAHTPAGITTMVGVTLFAAWLVTDAMGPRWLHSLSLPAAVLFIAASALAAAYAGWIGGP